MRQFGITAKKGLSQHFLIDRDILETVIHVAVLQPSDRVVEVGPGLGTLTAELVARASSVIAVEIDASLVQGLRERLGGHANLRIVHGNVLDLDPETLLAELPASPTSGGYKVVANLPYHITAPVLRYFLEAPHPPTEIAVMVQREVGQRITAAPGDMSLLAVSVQFYAQPRIVATVPPEAFYPPPEVSSVILSLHVLPEPAVPVPSREVFFEVVRAGFAQPRKQIRNPLTSHLGLTRAEATSLLLEAGVDPTRRAQTLSLLEWAHLARAYDAWRGREGSGEGEVC